MQEGIVNITLLFKQVMCRYSCPDVLITDQGKEFVNKLSAELYLITNTEHRITTAYHPQVISNIYVNYAYDINVCIETNGLTERFNQTLSRCLAKVCNKDHNNWDEKIDTILMSYRASSQTSTKHSPFFMLYQQDMRLPVDAELMRNGVDSEGVDSEGEEDLDKVMDILLEKRKEVFEKVEKNIKRAQQYQNKRMTASICLGNWILDWRC